MRARYVLSEVGLGLWRNVTMTIAMIVTMAVSLALLGAGILLYLQVQDMREFFYAKVEVSIFLKKDITDEQRDAINKELEGDPLVKEKIYESKETAYQRFKEQFKGAPALVNATKPDSLPESFRVKLRDTTQFDAIRDKYAVMPGVDEVIDQRQILDKVFKMIGALQGLALVVAIVQGAAALMLVMNTIQVAAYSRRREVSIMKMVGASNWFIQAPFVLEAVFAGLIGAVLAWLILVLSKLFLIEGALEPLFLAGVITPVTWLDVHLMLPILAGVATVVSAITGWITLRFYIRT